MMTYMDKYPIVAWFIDRDDALEYQGNHPELSIIIFCNGYGLIKEETR